MGLFRSVMDLFRSKTEENHEKPTAEFPREQTETAAELPEEQTETAEFPTEQTETAAELPEEQTETAEFPTEQTETAAELPEEQTETVQAQPKVAPGKPKYEARPDPDKAGWGLAIGQEIFKVPEDRASQEIFKVREDRASQE